MKTLGRILLWILEGCVYAVGAVAVINLIWHITALALFVTVGPGAPRLRPPLEGQLTVLVVALCSFPAIACAAYRLRRSRGRIDTSLVLQMGSGLFALAMSYRFGALLLLLGVLVCHSVNTEARRILAWWMWSIALLVCLTPIDISLRLAVNPPRPRFVETMNCEAATRQIIEENRAGLLVCVGDGPTLYNEPSEVLVW